MKLQNAYDTISNPEKRRTYNAKWTGIRDTPWAQQDTGRRQAEAADAEKKRATEEKAKKQKEDNERQGRLRILQSMNSSIGGAIFEVSCVIRKLTTELKHLQDQDDEDLRKEKGRNSWRECLVSPIYDKMNETDEQTQAQEIERLHRIASKNIKEHELHEKQATLQRLEDALQNVNNKIAAEEEKVDDETRAHEAQMALERARQAAAARRRIRRAQEQAQQRRAEQEADEYIRQVVAAERRRREAEKEETQRMRAGEEEATRKDGTSRND